MSYIEYLKSIFGIPTVIFYSDDEKADDKNEDKDKDAEKDDEDKKTYTKEDMERAIDRRQKALKEKRKVEEEYEELKKRLDDLPKPEEYEKIKNEYLSLKQQMDAVAQKKEEEELAKLNEKEREHIKERKELEAKINNLSGQLAEFQNKNKDYDDKIKKYQEKVEKYQGLGLENAIMTAAGRHNAFNARQIVNLLKGDFKLDDKGDWVYEIYNQRGELADVLDVGERVKIFLEDPENENLLTASVKPGSGTPPDKRGAHGKDMGAAEPTDEMYAWAKKRDLNVTKDSPKELKAKLIKWYSGLVKGEKPDQK